MAGSTELLETLAAEVAHRVHGRLEELARIELTSAPGATFRNAAVIASRQSVSILTLRTPWRMPRTISSTGTPQICGISPPNWLKASCNGCGTVDEPCITRCVFGSRR